MQHLVKENALSTSFSSTKINYNNNYFGELIQRNTASLIFIYFQPKSPFTSMLRSNFIEG